MPAATRTGSTAVTARRRVRDIGFSVWFWGYGFSDGETGPADLAGRTGGPGADPVAARAVAQGALYAERAARGLGRGASPQGELAVVPDPDLPGDARSVLVDLELGLQATVVRLDLELGGGTARTATSHTLAALGRGIAVVVEALSAVVVQRVWAVVRTVLGKGRGGRQGRHGED